MNDKMNNGTKQIQKTQESGNKDGFKKINVLVSGPPGNMATNVAEKVQKQPDMKLASIALTGEGMTSKVGNVIKLGGQEIMLIEPKSHKEALERYIAEEGEVPIIVDFVAPLVKGGPSPAVGNAELFCSLKAPFVTGSTMTKEEQAAVKQMVIASKNLAVIAPNMAPIIVIFQDMMEYAARKYPGALKGYSFEPIESHQGPRKKEAIKILKEVEGSLQITLTEYIDHPEELEKIAEEHPEVKSLILKAVEHLRAGKKDTSGTMRSVIRSASILVGSPIEEKDIKIIRDPEVQEKELGVPKEYLNGHGWHWYNFVSPDKTVSLDLSHRVNGRDVYGLGALAPVRFIYKKRQEGETGAFTMIDVFSGQ